MTTYSKPICLDCTRKHARVPGKWGLFCDAFPDGDGIPDAILTSRADHHAPYFGDHGLQFNPKSPEAAADAARIIAEANLSRAQAERPVIDLDADPHNANWLRRPSAQLKPPQQQQH